MKKLKVKNKKLLSILLVLIMAVQVFPSSAFAQDGNSQSVPEENAVVEEEIDSQADASVTEEDTDSGEEVAGTEEIEGSSLSEGWYPGAGARTAAAGSGQDITAYINFGEGTLKQVDGTEIQADGSIFKYGLYIFSIEWSVNFANLGTTLIAEDYFTFKVPVEIYNKTNLDVKNSDGDTMAVLTIDDYGNGRVTFNSEVENLTDISGGISVGGEYKENSKGQIVDWIFEFGKTYEYTGTSGGREYPAGSIDVDIEKQGWQSSGTANTVIWTARINIREEPWTGEVKVADSLDDDHKMRTIWSMETNIFGFYGLTDYYKSNRFGSINDPETRVNYYFGIAVIDWDKMRDDYNALLDWNRAQGYEKIRYYEDKDGNVVLFSNYSTDVLKESSYSMPDSNLDIGVSKFMYYFMIEAKDKDKKCLYVSPYEDGLANVIVTDRGFELTFPEGALDETSYYIRYCTELTSPISPNKVYNNISVSGENYEDEIIRNVDITIKAYITGKKGEIKLYKYDEPGITPLSGVKFNLKEPDIFYDSTEETDANAMAIFTLRSDGNGNGYAGNYTLKEVAAPSGYELMEDITLTLNESGEITHVNGNSTPWGTTIRNQTGDRICQISSDGLGLIVYNGKTPVGGFEVTKVDSENNSVTLKGAGFYLYYIDADNEPNYYTESGGWSTNLGDAKDLETDSLGKLAVTGLEYRTYYLEEITAPSGYEVSGTPTEITINSETKQSITVENTAKTTDFEFCKVDADKYASGNTDGLLGAAFELYVYNPDSTCSEHSELVTEEGVTDGCWTLVETKTSIGTEGAVKFEGLKEIYIYQLVETTAPEGYQLPSGQWKIKVTDATADELEDRFNITTMGDTDLQDFEVADETYYLGNILQITADFIFRKVNVEDKTEKLPGAEFTLYTCENTDNGHTHDTLVTDDSNNCWTEVVTKTSGTGGLVSFIGLTDGEYMLVETKAPEGYQRPTGQWKITIVDGLIDENDGIIAVGDTKPLAFETVTGDDEADYLLGNMPNYTMPVSGGDGGLYRFTLIGCLLIGCGFGLLTIIRLRKRYSS